MWFLDTGFSEIAFTTYFSINVAGIINLSIGSPSSVQSALDFLYGQEPDIELHTAYNLMETADFLMIDELKKICVKKIKSFMVSSKTCLTLLSISSRFDIFIPKLEDYYLSHLPELMKQEQMLEIDTEAVRQILTDKTLSYVSREDVINYLLRWIAFNSSERKSDFREMLSYIDKYDFSYEILRTIHDTHPDLVDIIHETHLESHFTYGKNQVTWKENGSDVFVLYPPEQKLSMLIFYGFNLKNECWYRIPVQSEVLPRAKCAIAHGKDTLFTLDMNTETVSVFSLASGQSSEKKILFQDGAYVLAFHIPLAVSGQSIYIAKNFHSTVLNTSAECMTWNRSALDLNRTETSAVVYASANLENHEINMEPLFSIDFQVDMMCVARDLLCLLSQTTQQLIVHCLKRHIRTSINLSSYSLVGKDGTLSSSGSHVYILADNLVVDIEFEASPKKILWKAHTVFPNEMFYAALFLSKLTQDKIVKQIRDNKRRELTLKWQEIGITKSAESTNKVHDINIPKKLSYDDEHRLIQLQLPRHALKCHIDCPHCKDKEAERLDLYFRILKHLAPMRKALMRNQMSGP